MSSGVIFERVYRALKDQIGRGRFASGQHLEPAALSKDLNASITPVRDALHRLAGEGLVETPRSEGFRMPHVTEMGLRHLYRWNAALLDLAVRLRSSAIVSDAAYAGETTALVDLTETLFLEIAGASGNPEHVAALARLNDRLRAVRHIEIGLVDEPALELTRIRDRCAGEAVPLRRALAAYHRRREKLVGEFVAILLAPR